MKYPEYAATRGVTEDVVKEALAAIGKPVHPNHHVDEAALDAHLKVGPGAPDPDATIENVHGEQNGTLPGPVEAATPADVQPEPEPPVDPDPVDDTPRPEREPTLADPNVDRKGAQQELAAREIPDSQKPKSQRFQPSRFSGDESGGPRCSRSRSWGARVRSRLGPTGPSAWTKAKQSAPSSPGTESRTPRR